MGLVFPAFSGIDSGAASAAQLDFFEAKVRPLLITHCYECHSEESGKKKGGLLLDNRHGWETGGDSGPAIIPGNADESLTFTAVSYRDSDLKMPPDGRMPEEDIAILKQWIAMGAPDPRSEGTSAAQQSAPVIDLASARKFWAFQAPTHNEGDTIDSIVGEKLREQQLAPVPPASRRNLIRRAFHSLHGMPPSPDELARYLDDDRPDAFARMVDELLASPRYGERWGRHWLDIARYADTNGLDENMAYTSAFRYRDYVIRAFNDDMPYDRFITEQLAGDLLPTNNDPEHQQTIAAGFLSIGAKMLACDDPMKMRMDIVDDQIDTTGRAFLGLTFGCARCHDHKFDPISAKDYYGLAGIFKSTTTMTNYSVVAKWHEHDVSPPEVKALDAEISALEASKKDQDDEAKKETDKKLAALRADRESRSIRIMSVREGEPEDTKVHLRGNYLTLGEDAPRRFPVVLAGEEQPPIPQGQSGRLQLAQWIADPDNPLTARVMMNRLWRWHFGRGIVPSTDNFGRLGEAPTNQKLLDHLAVKFIESGWSIKAMHRYIMASETYRRSTQYDAASAEIDPSNTYLWRFDRRRLDAEEVRDSLLSISGLLDGQMFGQLLTDEFGKYANKGKLSSYWQTRRRAVYLPIMRSGVYDAFVAFDFADPSMIDGDRKASTVAPQSLFMMNGPLVFDAAKALAGKASATSDALADLYQRILGRAPEAHERTAAEAFVSRYPSDSGNGEDGLQALARVLLASNEFLYVE
ncbi:MAG: PSD1 domain-containing protein [Verrucomicrobiae bacterium]|nr:PSD1 domain-containing protein [Verrucomicrobiae bacterium]